VRLTIAASLGVAVVATLVGCGGGGGEGRAVVRFGDEIVNAARGTSYDVEALGKTSAAGRERLPPAVVEREATATDEYFDKLANAALDAECQGLTTMANEGRYPTWKEWGQYLSSAITNEALAIPDNLQPLTEAIVGGLFNRLDADGDEVITVEDAEDAKSSLC
jgi:hypothetical protein